MARRMTSRLARKEQKKLTRQTIVLIAVTVVILILFIFVILPGAVRLFFRIIGSDTAFEPQDDIPPQVPVLQAPVSATYTAKLEVEGFAEPESKVVFVLNAEEQDQVDVDTEGNFSYHLSLEPGENLLSVYGVDEAGNESVKTKSYQIIYDNQAPAIKVLEPGDGAKIELRKNQDVTVKGETEPNAKVYVNGRLVYADSNGSFSTSYHLNEGDNEIEIRAIDKAGNSATSKITVNFRL